MSWLRYNQLKKVNHQEKEGDRCADAQNGPPFPNVPKGDHPQAD
jgi:hypothetical protein